MTPHWEDHEPVELIIFYAFLNIHKYIKYLILIFLFFTSKSLISLEFIFVALWLAWGTDLISWFLYSETINPSWFIF